MPHVIVSEELHGDLLLYSAVHKVKMGEAVEQLILSSPAYVKFKKKSKTWRF